MTASRISSAWATTRPATDVDFDISRIDFSSDINYVCNKADTLLMVMPSPYFKDHVDKITADISRKNIVSAVKGIVHDTNELITDYMARVFGTSLDRTLVVSGPCHAEEVALDRPSYLTIGCNDLDLAEIFANCLRGNNTRAITSSDVGA